MHVNKGDFINAGQKITDVANFDQVLVVLYLSEGEVNKVKLGSTAQIDLLDERKLEGKVSFVSKIVESKTGSYRVEVKIINDEIMFLQGPTANVKLLLGKKFACKIPSLALGLNDEGILGVKIVDDNNYVVFTPIKIIDRKSDGV
nr:HlyD family efflux transporter periplasmic adaptor subunit [Wolbachia endosymbiont of Brugia pahangi]